MSRRWVYLGLLLATASLTVLVLAPQRGEPDEAGDGSANPAGAGSATAGAASSTAAPPAQGPTSAASPDGPDTPASAANPDSPPHARIDPRGDTACPAGMRFIEGTYCPYVAHRCLDYADEDQDVCTRYAPEVLCEGALKLMRYCVDEFEYPNREGALPAVMVDFADAERACAAEGKRLCTTKEWEFACEGPQMWPYPYGLTRSAEACNIDRELPRPDLQAFEHPFEIAEEVGRLDQREPSGSRTGCVSPFGVHDMTGNVDEWVQNPEGSRSEKPFYSALKGGYWGPIRARCRPMTSSHNEWFRFYQVGFRCCSDASPPEAGEAPGDDGLGKGPGGWRPLPSP